MPLTATVLPLPTFLSENAAVVALNDRLSPLNMPLNVAPPALMVALVFASYTLLFAVMFVTLLMVALLISAVRVPGLLTV